MILIHFYFRGYFLLFVLLLQSIITLDPVPSPAILSEPAVLKGVRSFPNASAPGPSGLRPSHLQEAIRCPSPDCAAQALTTLTSLVNLLAAGRAPPSVLPTSVEPPSLPCPRRAAVTPPHPPIAVGEVLRRLASKCLASTSCLSAISSLTPFQLGVGVKGGCEAIIHTPSHLLSSSDDPDQCRCLFLDFSNAFNCISKESMFAEIWQRIPHLAAWMESCYSCQPLLHLGEDTIHSCSGVQQGDPLGPLDFALTLQPLLERLQADVSGLRLNVWYLDDDTLMGSPEDLAAALHIVEREGPPLGLHLNRSKSLLYIPEDAVQAQSVLPTDIPTTRRGFSLLGCPIGPLDYCEEVFGARLSKLKESLRAALHSVGDSQVECTLLRSCLALPKVSFILHACPPSHIQRTAAEFDRAICCTLETIAGGPVSHWSWLKASLPCSHGGLNLRSALHHSPATFLASTSVTNSLVLQILASPPDPSPHITPTVSCLATEAARPDWKCLDDIDVPLQQKCLSHVVDEACFQQLLDSAPTCRSRALALSSSLHAGDWLNIIPSTTLGLHLHDREFRCCLRYWLWGFPPQLVIPLPGMPPYC